MNDDISPNLMAEVRKLYPHYTEKQLREIALRFRGYVAVVLRIHERLKAERMAAIQLTGPDMDTKADPGGTKTPKQLSLF